MKPDLPELPEDDTYLDETRAAEAGHTRDMKPITPRPANIPAAPPPRRPPPPQKRPATAPQRRNAARSRRDSGLYLPLWSLALMLLFVIVMAMGIVMLVIGLGGNTAPESAPVIIVSSPIPTERPASFPDSPATATIPPALDPNLTGITPAPPVSFALSGPTLEPVIISPTPRNITVGERVQVFSVRPDQLNVRDNPGVTGTVIVFRASEGAEFLIVDGPQQADGLTWWRIQNEGNQTEIGWAAANYLQIPPGS